MHSNKFFFYGTLEMLKSCIYLWLHVACFTWFIQITLKSTLCIYKSALELFLPISLKLIRHELCTAGHSSKLPAGFPFLISI